MARLALQIVEVECVTRVPPYGCRESRVDKIGGVGGMEG
jgi:hypothetical protein